MSPGGGGAGHPNPALTVQNMSPRAGNAPTEPTIMVSLDKNDLDGDGSTSDTVTLELLRDRLGSVIACSTDANQGKAGPFVVERIDYLGGYGAAAYSDIILSGYVSGVSQTTVTLSVFTHFEPGVTSLATLTNCMVGIEPGTDDSDYNLVTSASWNSNDIVLTTGAAPNFAVGDYVEIWPEALKRHSSTTPTESNGRTTVTTAAGFSPLETDSLIGCYLLDLDAGDLRVPVVITDNNTTTFAVEGTNLYTDTEFADGENYFRVYRRSSAVGNPFGFAGGWLVSGNYSISSNWRSVKQLWYFWNRHYEPEYLLRWLQPDPIGPWGDESALGDAFAYGAYSPLSNRDSTATTVRLPGGTRNHGSADEYFVRGNPDAVRQQLLRHLNFLLAGCGAVYAEEVPDRQGTRFELRLHVAHRHFTPRVNQTNCWCDCTTILDYFERALDPSILIGVGVGTRRHDWKPPGGPGGGETTFLRGPYQGIAFVGPKRAGTINAEYAVTLAHELFGHALPFAERREYYRSAIFTGNDFYEHLRCVYGAVPEIVVPPNRHVREHWQPRLRRGTPFGDFHPDDPYHQPWNPDLRDGPIWNPPEWTG